MENEFTTLFSCPFGILDARFEPLLTKKSLNFSAMLFLIVITFLFTIREFEADLF